MDPFFAKFRQAMNEENGYKLAETLEPEASSHDAGRLYAFHRATNQYSVQTDMRYAIIYNSETRLPKQEANAWLDVFVKYYQAIGEILAAEEATNQRKAEDHWNKVYEAWKEVVNALHRGYSSAGFPAWSIPCLYVGGKYLRQFAIKADEHAAKAKEGPNFNGGLQDDIAVDAAGKNDKLEDAARQINRLFALCISDRAPIEESRKWGLYYITNLLFKTYFKLNSVSLSKNIMRSLQATRTDMPPLEAFPKAHIVTFKYYAGVIHFLEEDYKQAEEHLTEAWRLCTTRSPRNLELILTYLIPCHLLTTHTLPSPELLAPHPRLQALFTPLATCIRRGDLAGFDEALSSGEDEFVKRRIYLTLERGRDICMRNLFRKVFIAGGYEELKEGQTEKDRIRRTRVAIQEFEAAVHMAMGLNSERLDRDEVECFIANMIYKNHMAGYIARERGFVVLSKKGAFPGTGV